MADPHPTNGSGGREPRGRHPAWLLTWITVAVLTAGQLALVRSLPDRGVFVKYPHYADRILAGDVPRERLGDLSPGYLWTIVALRFLGLSAEGIVIVQLASLGASALFTALAASRLGGPVAGLVAALGLLASRGTIVNATDLEPEAAILLCNSLGLALALTWASSRRSWLLGGSGAAFGASIALRPVAALPMMALLAWCTLLRHRAAGRAGLAGAWRALPLSYLLAALLPPAAAAGAGFLLTGSPVVMDPGMVLYEGMNPGATPCGGTDPVIVKDVERTLQEPDSLHEAYRIVAARALAARRHGDGGPGDRGSLDARGANRYWTARAMAFARAYPRAAATLVARKLRVAVSSHEVYDLATQARKDELLRGYPFVPFGALFGLSLAALLLARGPSGVAGAVLYAAATTAVMPIFYVSVRQRNPLVPGMAVLGALGAVEIARQLRRRPSRVAFAAACALAAAIVTTMETPESREDRRSWWIAEQALRHSVSARRAADAGDGDAVRQHLVAAATWPSGDPPTVPPDVLAAACLHELPGAAPERRFDLALSLLDAGEPGVAEGVLAELQEAGYRPIRGNMTVSSISYHRARALMRLGRPGDACRAAEKAEAEAPGDPLVLALVASCRRRSGDGDGAGSALALLHAIHDPFTADVALARAAADSGDHSSAVAALERAAAGVPEWRRPQDLRDRLSR